MSAYLAGSFVTHAKLPELGAGEVISLEKGTMRIRFASGERAFSVDAVQPHLLITQEAPARPAPSKAKASRAKAKPKVKKSSLGS